MRRIICNIPRRRVTPFSTAGDGGRGRGILPTDPNSEKPNVRTPHTFVSSDSVTDIFDVVVGTGRGKPTNFAQIGREKRQVVTDRKQLKNEEKARKALGTLFRDYCGRATRDDDLADEEKAELDVLVTNLNIECKELDYETCICVREELGKVLEKVVEKKIPDNRDDGELDDDRVDKIAELAEDDREEMDAFLTNSFVTNLMIECEPKYEKLFRKVIEKVREKMIRDDRILNVFIYVTDFMFTCEPDYEKLLRQVLEKVVEKITTHREDHADEEKVGKKVGNENIRKIRKLGKLARNVEDEVDAFVIEVFLTNLTRVEKMKPYFMAYEVIEKVAKKVGNENVRKIAEEELDSFVTELFITNLGGVDRMKLSFVGKWKWMD